MGCRVNRIKFLEVNVVSQPPDSKAHSYCQKAKRRVPQTVILSRHEKLLHQLTEGAREKDDPQQFDGIKPIKARIDFDSDIEETLDLFEFTPPSHTPHGITEGGEK